ncbi:hypothetical protein HIM_09688 [Hirsutella minnesotensis 3608]|uniref:Uncharacterized protein n=1 Tax=Hirsutella minnesotensis 3608 TaxID=1043627 RepID=A0A0F7ZXL6_9HYPO|nr:hypothetical protein HIM_09688 [Hirsutella minnesotensis 3608]
MASLPDGTNFRAPNLQPDSHFPRSLNSEWKDGENKKISKFRLHEWPGIYRRGPKDAEIRVPYWNPYDLLGYFISLLGPAPQAANKSNYFLPLTAVYARWCSRIAGRAPAAYKYPDPGNGAGNWPFMFQCTWHDDGDKKPSKWFFLGASIGGDSWSAQQTGTWKENVQLRRFDMMFACLQIKLFRQGDFENRRAPEQLIADGSAVPFGNCAESYPFTEKIFRDKTKNRGLYGLALKRDFMRDHNLNEYDGSLQGVVWSNLVGPCRNCAALIERSGALQEHFTVDLGRNLV